MSSKPLPNTVRLFDRNVLCANHAVLAQRAVDIQPGQYAFFCNVHMLMLSQTDPVLAQAMDAADLVFPDGVPVAWLQQRLTRKDTSVLRGYEAMELICERAAKFGESVGLLGATNEVLRPLAERLQSRFPGLRIGFSHAPPMMEENAPVDMALVAAIRNAHPDFLFVGLGCPKQEKWIHRHRDHLDSALLGVGAAFGWLSGTSPKPPRWMERVGMGWLFRLVSEPRRMAKRYFLYNTQFIFATAKLLFLRSKPQVDTPSR